MVRYTIENEQSPITVAYGYDHISGVFLSVCDKRLKYDSTRPLKLIMCSKTVEYRTLYPGTERILIYILVNSDSELKYPGLL